MAAIERPEYGPPSPKDYRQLWLLESGTPSKSFREYLRDQLASIYLTLEGNPNTTPKKLFERALGLLLEVHKAAYSSDSNVPAAITQAAYYATRGDNVTAEAFLKGESHRLVRPIQAWMDLGKITHSDEEKILREKAESPFVNSVLINIAKELISRENGEQSAKNVIFLDSQREEVPSKDVVTDPIVERGDIFSARPLLTPGSLMPVPDEILEMAGEGRQAHPIFENTEAEGTPEAAPTALQPGQERPTLVLQITPDRRRAIRKGYFEVDQKLGPRMRAIRQALGLSLAQVTSTRGMRESLRVIELGEAKSMSRELAVSLAMIFGLELEDLLKGGPKVDDILNKDSKTPKDIITPVVRVERKRRAVRSDQLAIDSNFGKKIEQIRTALGLSREELIGTGKFNLREIEHGNRAAITKALAQELAERLGITVADLFDTKLSVEEIMKRNPQPKPLAVISRDSSHSDPQTKTKIQVVSASKVAHEEELPDSQTRVKRFVEDLMELKAKGIATIKEKKSGELFLFTEDGEEYCLVQDGRLRIRSKTGVFRMERFEETTNSRVISALQQALNKR